MVDHLLDAAVEQFALTGIRRTSADDIARRAGVNRATLYRRLGTKEQIVSAAVLRETGKTLARIESAIGPVPAPDIADFDPVAYLITMFSTTLDEVRGNPLLQQLMLKDRDETLFGLTAGAGDVVLLASGLVVDRILDLRRHVRNPRTDDVHAIASALSRITQSLLLTPSGPPDLSDPIARTAFVEAVVVPLVLGPS